jgi:hypothetical protein
LAILDVFEADFEFGGPAVAPSRKELSRVGGQLLVDVVPIGLQDRDLGKVVKERIAVCDLIGGVDTVFWLIQASFRRIFSSLSTSLASKAPGSKP